MRQQLVFASFLSLSLFGASVYATPKSAGKQQRSGQTKSVVAKSGIRPLAFSGAKKAKTRLRHNTPLPTHLVPLSIPTAVAIDLKEPHARIDKTVAYLRSAAFSLQAPVSAMAGGIKLTVRPGQSKMDVLGDYRSRSQGNQGQYLKGKDLKNGNILEAVGREAAMAGYTDSMVFAVHHLRGKAEIYSYYKAIVLQGKKPQLARVCLEGQRVSSPSQRETWYSAFDADR